MTSFSVFLPWEFSPGIALACTVALGVYAAGLARGAMPGPWRASAFFGGVLLLYAVTQTQFDYYARYLFAAHRAQHLVLHHLAPFLIVLSAPASVFAAGLGRRGVLPRPRNTAWNALATGYRMLQHPLLAGVLFVGLIAFWLVPAIHFDAMLSHRLYALMSWSMALDGLLFWYLVFAHHHDRVTPCLSLGGRILLVTLIIPPQVLIGALLAFGERPLFDIYDVCGRALALSPLEDQQLGGLITWVPAVMMSMAAVLILLARHLTDERAREAGND